MANLGLDAHLYLQGLTSVTSIAGDRGSPVSLKKDEMRPQYAYAVISGDHLQHLTAISGVAVLRLQITCHAQDQITANNLAEQIRLALMRPTPLDMNGNIVDKVLHDNGPLDQTIRPIDGSPNWRYIVVNDYLVFCTEAIPT